MSTRSTPRRLTVVVWGLGCLVAGCVDQQLRREFTRGDHGMLEPRAMHLVLCGTAGAVPDRISFGPCTAVVAAGQVILVDAGPGAWEGAYFAGLPLDAVRSVLLTTFLAEDVAELPEVITRSWVAGRSRRLRIYGPPGTARVVRGLIDVLGFDVAMRLTHHDAAILDPALAGAEAHEFVLDDPEGSAVVLEEGGLRVTAFSVGAVGGIPSVGYRFDHQGRSIVVAGHARNHPNVARFAAGADLLVHEAAQPDMVRRGVRVMEDVGQTRLASLTRDMLRGHATPVEAATTARDADVGCLVLSRLYPPPSLPLMRWAFLRGVRAIFPHTVLGEDGMRFRLDARPPLTDRRALVQTQATHAAHPEARAVRCRLDERPSRR